jgi:hypothetical protein
MFYWMSAAMGGQPPSQAARPAEGRAGAKQGQGAGHGREIGGVEGEGKAQSTLLEAVPDPAWTALSYRPEATTPTLLLLKESGRVIGPELVEMVPELRVMLWAEGMVALKVSVVPPGRQAGVDGAGLRRRGQGGQGHSGGQGESQGLRFGSHQRGDLRDNRTLGRASKSGHALCD